MSEEHLSPTRSGERRPLIHYVNIVANRDRFVQSLAQYFPEITDGKGKRALDVGCGSSRTPGDTQDTLAAFGYTWVGVDMTMGRASLLADAHFLPFAAHSFDLIVSIAAFEHMRKPWLVAQELGRIARPGCLLVGTTAFLEAEHTKSYFHMSHRGIESFLDEADFDTLAVWPGWTVQDAMAWFTFVEGGAGRRFFTDHFTQRRVRWKM